MKLKHLTKLKADEWDCIEPEERLRLEIILQACRDFKLIMSGLMDETSEHNLTEIKFFFKNGWCDMLLYGFDYDATEIFNSLKKLYPERTYRERKKRRRK